MGASEQNLTNIIDLLKMERSVAQRSVAGDIGLKYLGVADLVFSLGRTWTGSSEETDIIGEKGKCFQNAAELATNNTDMLYVEGWATSDECVGLPLSHAWCVNAITGHVVDPTWDISDTAAYVGVVIPDSELWQHLLRTKHWGLLFNDWRFKHYLLRNGLHVLDDFGSDI